MLENKKLGQVFTPFSVASFMAKQLNYFKPSEVLDPGAGTGVLIEASLKHILNASVFGIEKDEILYNICLSKNLNVINADFFDFDKKVEAIIMNPPYIRQELIDNKDELNLKLGRQMPAQANLYVYYFYKAIQTLKKDGIIISIMPNTWLNSAYGNQLQSDLVENYKIIKLINFGNDVFEDAIVDTSIIVIQNSTPNQNSKILFYDISKSITDSDIEGIIENKNMNTKTVTTNQLTQHKLKNKHWLSYRTRLTTRNDMFEPINNIFKIQRGTTTNYNNFFILEGNSEWPRKYPNLFSIIVNKQSEIEGYKIKKDQLKKVVFNTQASKYELPSDVQNRINMEEKNIVENQKPKTIYNKIQRNPNTWFNQNISGKKSLIFNYIIRDNIKFIYNPEKIIVKDNFYVLSLDSTDDDLYYLYISILNSTINKYFLEFSGRSYGSGLLKIQKYQLEDMHIINRNFISPVDCKELIFLGKKLTNNVYIDETINEIDKKLLNYYFDPHGIDLEVFYKEYEAIKKIRKGENI